MLNTDLRPADSRRAPVAAHRLKPLLEPQSVALVGASPREETIGNLTLKTMKQAAYGSRLYPVNPKYDEIEGLRSYPDLDALPERVDMALLNLASHRMEEALEAAIAAEVGSVLILDPLHIEGETGGDALIARLRRRAADAGLPVCGGNCAGILDYSTRSFATFFQPPTTPAGGISLIAHSGMMLVWTRSDPRYRFDMALHVGQEVGVTQDEYLDYMLDRPTTKVVAMFVEGVRNPEGMDRALRKALDVGKPVVICMVGRTKRGASLSVTHTGATVADGDLARAFFEARGAVVVETLDDMYNTALLLEQGRRAPADGAAYVLDSGGCRGLLVDRAEALDVKLATLTEDTSSRLKAQIPPMLVPVNPFDGAGPVDENYAKVFEIGYKEIERDPNVGLIGIEFHFNDRFNPRVGAVEAMLNAWEVSSKPFFYFTSITPLPNEGLGIRLADMGIPAIDGQDNALRVAKWFMRSQNLRDEARARAEALAGGDKSVKFSDAQHDRLAAPGAMSEAESLALLEGLGMPVVTSRHCSGIRELCRVAKEIGYPVVLKADVAGLHHKTEAKGVVLGLADEAALRRAHEAMAANGLGESRVVQTFVTDGVEFSLGMLVDPDFGPFVTLSGGGRNVELFRERVVMPAEMSAEDARRAVSAPAVARLLDGARGFIPDTQSLAEALHRFGRIALALATHVREIDINPVVVTERGAIAVDALIVRR
ncbi:MAG: acetate--CoA ligase family protein [Roseovarius sp.]